MRLWTVSESARASAHPYEKSLWFFRKYLVLYFVRAKFVTRWSFCNVKQSHNRSRKTAETNITFYNGSFINIIMYFLTIIKLY